MSLLIIHVWNNCHSIPSFMIFPSREYMMIEDTRVIVDVMSVHPVFPGGSFPSWYLSFMYMSLVFVYRCELCSDKWWKLWWSINILFGLECPTSFYQENKCMFQLWLSCMLIVGNIVSCVLCFDTDFSVFASLWFLRMRKQMNPMKARDSFDLINIYRIDQDKRGKPFLS